MYGKKPFHSVNFYWLHPLTYGPKLPNKRPVKCGGRESRKRGLLVGWSKAQRVEMWCLKEVGYLEGSCFSLCIQVSV